MIARTINTDQRKEIDVCVELDGIEYEGLAYGRLELGDYDSIFNPWAAQLEFAEFEVTVNGVDVTKKLDWIQIDDIKEKLKEHYETNDDYDEE